MAAARSDYLAGMLSPDDERYMRLALQEAKEAFKADEVPR